MEEEIQKILLENSQVKKTAENGIGMDEFYKVMGDFYSVTPKHESPTKRLRDMKDSAFIHKKVLK